MKATLNGGQPLSRMSQAILLLAVANGGTLRKLADGLHFENLKMSNGSHCHIGDTTTEEQAIKLAEMFYPEMR